MLHWNRAPDRYRDRKFSEIFVNDLFPKSSANIRYVNLAPVSFPSFLLLAEMKTCHHVAEVECNVATTVTVLSVTAVNRNDIDSFLCPNIEFNLREIQPDPEQLVSCRLIVRESPSRIHGDSPCPLSQSPCCSVEWIEAQWSMMGLIYFHFVDNYWSPATELQLMEPLRGEDVRKCNLNAMKYDQTCLWSRSFCKKK